MTFTRNQVGHMRRSFEARQVNQLNQPLVSWDEAVKAFERDPGWDKVAAEAKQLGTLLRIKRAVSGSVDMLKFLKV